MKTHTTNYANTFIEVADDCPAAKGKIPPSRKKRTIADLQHEIISNHPYKFTPDDVIFRVHAKRSDLSKRDYASEREQYFSKGRACLRSSPLTKRYGWGIYFDENSKIALYGVETDEYEKFLKDEKLKHLKAMRSRKSNKINK